MKHKIVIVLLVTMVAIAAVQTAGTPASPESPPAAQPSPAPPTLSLTVDGQVTNYEKLVVAVAEAMPEDKYSFTPASLNIPGAAYKDVRTFAQLIKHTATANYFYWGAATGE